jgi:hypothetical protein
MVRIVTKCRECRRHVQYGDVKDYRDPNTALVALLNVERQETMGALVNAKWEPEDFQVRVKAYDHEIPKGIQPVSIALRCDGCGTTFLYSARDFFIAENST